MLLVVVLFLVALGASNLQLNETAEASNRLKEPMKRVYKDVPRLVELLKPESRKIWPSCAKEDRQSERFIGQPGNFYCGEYLRYKENIKSLSAQEASDKNYDDPEDNPSPFQGDEWFQHLMIVWEQFENVKRRKAPFDPELKNITANMLLIICDHKDDANYMVKTSNVEDNIAIEQKCKRFKRTYTWEHLLY